MKRSQQQREKLPKPQQIQLDQQHQQHRETSAFEAIYHVIQSQCIYTYTVWVDDQRKISQCTNQEEKKKKPTDKNKTVVFSLHFEFSCVFLCAWIYHCSRQMQFILLFLHIALFAIAIYWNIWISITNRSHGCIAKSKKFRETLP